jgi:hypothetical protein
MRRCLEMTRLTIHGLRTLRREERFVFVTFRMCVFDIGVARDLAELERHIRPMIDVLREEGAPPINVLFLVKPDAEELLTRLAPGGARAFASKYASRCQATI